MVWGARPRVLLAERSIAPLLRYAEAFRELVPVLGENVVFDRLRARIARTTPLVLTVAARRFQHNLPGVFALRFVDKHVRICGVRDHIRPPDRISRKNN